MSRTPRQIKLSRAVLEVLENIPEGYLLPDELLRSDISRLAVPPPSTAELDDAIRFADTKRRITGVASDDGMKWQIAPAGRAYLAENT